MSTSFSILPQVKTPSIMMCFFTWRIPFSSIRSPNLSGVKIMAQVLSDQLDSIDNPDYS